MWINVCVITHFEKIGFVFGKEEPFIRIFFFFQTLGIFRLG